jgi:hypothetical protein
VTTIESSMERNLAKLGGHTNRVLAFAAVLLGATATAGAEPSDDRSRGGLAFHVGAGSFYGGAGAAVEYQIRFSPRLRVTPFAGGGLNISTESDPVLTAPGWAGGAALEAGSLQRLLVAAGFGTQGITVSCEAGRDCMNEGMVHGPFVVLGYKGTAPFGLMWLAYYGASMSLDDPYEDAGTLHVALGVGVGWKL